MRNKLFLFLCAAQVLLASPTIRLIVNGLSGICAEETVKCDNPTDLRKKARQLIEKSMPLEDPDSQFYSVLVGDQKFFEIPGDALMGMPEIPLTVVKLPANFEKDADAFFEKLHTFGFIGAEDAHFIFDPRGGLWSDFKKTSSEVGRGKYYSRLSHCNLSFPHPEQKDYLLKQWYILLRKILTAEQLESPDDQSKTDFTIDLGNGLLLVYGPTKESEPVTEKAPEDNPRDIANFFNIEPKPFQGLKIKTTRGRPLLVVRTFLSTPYALELMTRFATENLLPFVPPAA